MYLFGVLWCKSILFFIFFIGFIFFNDFIVIRVFIILRIILKPRDGNNDLVIA